MANKNHSKYFTISDDHIITTPDISIEPTESLGSLMFTNMRKNREKIAQIDAKTGQKDTFGDLLQRSIRTALHMTDKKITREHIITLCTYNHLDSSVPYIAIQFLGAKAASIDPSLPPLEMIHLLKQVRPKMLFVTPESVTTIEEILRNISLDSEIVVFGKTTKHTEFAKFLQPHEDEERFEPVKIENLKDTALIHFSSGTTGMPKGICISHHCFVGQMLNARFTEASDTEYIKNKMKKMSFPTTQLGYTSLYWVSAGCLLTGSILAGSSRLVCQCFDAKEIWDIFQKYKPTVLMITPIQAMDMLANRRTDVDVGSIAFISVIGSSISKEYLMKLQEVFPTAMISHGYGQTEVCGGLALFKPNDAYHRSLMQNPDKIESVGLPLRGVTYRIVDLETNKNLGPNQRGELRIKGKFIMNGYHNADSSETFDEDGWLKTGDILYYDQDCCFYVVDRIKEAFKYQGWFIAPTMLENVLLEHPAVKQAVVIGIPKDDGSHPMGLVVVDENIGVTEEEIEKFVEERVLERQRLRAGVKFIEKMPLTVTGKVNRKEIRGMFI